MQKSKVKTARIIAASADNSRKSLRDALPFLRARKAKAVGPLLLPFAFCLLTFAFALCLFPAVLSAQGCAMCYTSASAARAGATEALANGVLILLVPPMVFFVLIGVVVYRYRNRFREMPVVRGGELPIVECRLPFGGIDDCRLAIEGIENGQSAIINRQSAMDYGRGTTGKQTPWAR